MAVPKGKVSKARRDKRRSSHWKLETPGIVTCPKCGAYRLPHRMCKSCLTYNGREFGQVSSQYKKRRCVQTQRLFLSCWLQQNFPLDFCIGEQAGKFGRSGTPEREETDPVETLDQTSVKEMRSCWEAVFYGENWEDPDSRDNKRVLGNEKFLEIPGKCGTMVLYDKQRRFPNVRLSVL